MKTYVTDTSILMDHPNLYDRMSNCVVVVPVTVIGQLDGLKNSTDQTRANAARAASSVLDRLGAMGDIRSGVTIGNNVTVRTTVDYDKIDDGTGNLSDDKIIGVALRIKKEGEDDVILKTTDKNMRNVARAYGILSEGLSNEMSNIRYDTASVDRTSGYDSAATPYSNDSDILKTIARKFGDTGVAADAMMAIGMIIIFLLGWLIASSMFYIADGTHTHHIAMFQDRFATGLRNNGHTGACCAIAFAAFMVSYIIAYSRHFIESDGLYGIPSGNRLFTYRAIALVQAFTAGIILNAYRLLPTTMDFNLDVYAHSDAIMFKMWLIVLGTITISTWLIRFIRPAFAIAFMPIAVFLFGTIASSVVLKNSGAQYLIDNHQIIETSATHILTLLYNPLPLGVVPILLSYAVAAALFAGLFYGIARPYKVYSKWGGHQLGGALNGFIAASLVMAPYFGDHKSALCGGSTILSVVDGIAFTSPTLYSYLVWSWMIGNSLTFVSIANKFKTIYRKRRAAVRQNQRTDTLQHYPQASYNLQARPVIEEKPANVVAPPSEENRERFLNSLYGQQDALKRLWDGTLYPVLRGQKIFGNAILLGPTGLGKTETAKKIADIFYGGRLLRFDMNQYGTEWEATRMFGSAPGYVGSDQGGKLPTGLKDMSPCVILLDEIEKAHPSILQTLLQLCGEGYAEDSRGQRHEANQSIILMTSNIWPGRANELWTMAPDRLKKALQGYISPRSAQTGPVQLFSPEFLGRVNTVSAYKPFSKEMASIIISDMMKQIASQYGITVLDGSSSAIVDALEISGGFRGLQDAFDDYVRSLISSVGVVPQNSTLEITKKSGKVYINLKTNDGTMIAQTVKDIQKGYALDTKKLLAWEISPLKAIFGQDAQIAEIVSHLKIAASGFVASPNRPMGIFLLAGPTGVGKTETARALATWLFDGRLIRKDMGEYQSPYDGARLFGDRNKMGDLTREVQEVGNCVVLLDEIEKANPQVLNTLLAPFDEGVMTDAAVNVSVSFKNTIIIMTTNLEPDSSDDPNTLAELSDDKRRDLFAYHFKKEFLGRVNKVLLYNELSKDAIAVITKRRVEQIVARKKEDDGVLIRVDNDVYTYLSEMIQSSDYGVRGADVAIANFLGSAVAETIAADEIHILLRNNQVVAEKVC